VTRNETICLLGLPMDLGQSRRGVDMGPSAIRYAGLGASLRGLGCHLEHPGDVPIPDRDALPSEGGLAYLPAAASACRSIYDIARQAVERSSFPLFLGGDHSLAVGTVGGVTHDEPAAVLWIDAHGDMNTPETSPSGNLHGMPLAALLGHGLDDLVNLGRVGAKIEPRDVVLLGVRDLDPGEQLLIQDLGVKAYTMRQIDEIGISRVVVEALDRLSHRDRLHVSLDMDALDPSEAPGVGTPSPGGLTYREAHLLMETIAETGRLISADVVEVNPILDDRNRTARLACELVSSLLGKRIL
jgi:arginase